MDSAAAAHREKFHVYNEALIHSATCHEPNCTVNEGRCHKVKTSIDHFVRCYGPRRKTQPIESCESCSRIWGLLCYHAKTCATPPGAHCVVSQCDYLREKIARKLESDQAELQSARESLQMKLEEWPVERRIEQLELDRQHVLQLIATIRAQRDARTATTTSTHHHHHHQQQQQQHQQHQQGQEMMMSLG